MPKSDPSGSPPVDSTGYQPRTVPAATITYDAVGNRTDSSATYATGNRLQQFGGTTFGADLDGNVTQKLDGSGNGPRYYWSADGLLDSVVAGTVRLRYDYNTLGQLVRRSRNGVVERHFLWDGDQLLAELDGAATSRIGEYAYYPGVDQPLAVITGATTPTSTRYAVSDVTGSVIGLVDGTTVSEQYSYDPWGALGSTPTGSANRLRWQGLVWESDSTQLYYARNRWYDPRVGRFMTEDPIGLNGGINAYTFDGNDTINGTDPFGLAPGCTDPSPPLLAVDRPRDEELREYADASRAHGPNGSPAEGRTAVAADTTCIPAVSPTPPVSAPPLPGVPGGVPPFSRPDPNCGLCGGTPPATGPTSEGGRSRPARNPNEPKPSTKRGGQAQRYHIVVQTQGCPAEVGGQKPSVGVGWVLTKWGVERKSSWLERQWHGSAVYTGSAMVEDVSAGGRFVMPIAGTINCTTGLGNLFGFGP